MKTTILLVILLTAQAQAATMAPTGGHTKFTAVATGALKINGKGDKPEGKLEITEKGDKLEVSGALKIKLSSLTTGLSLRDGHMKDKYLEVEKYPEALLTIPKQSIPKGGSGAFEGDLILHGVKSKVSGTVEARLVGDSAEVKAAFPVKLQDHGIAIPSFAGVSVANEVSVETEFQTVKN